MDVVTSALMGLERLERSRSIEAVVGAEFSTSEGEAIGLVGEGGGAGVE